VFRKDIQIFDNGEGLEQGRRFAINERRQRHHRIDDAASRFVLRPLYQVDVDLIVRRQPLEVERDAHPTGCERAPEREQPHHRKAARANTRMEDGLRDCSYPVSVI
jgi:hypothetical protein